METKISSVFGWSRRQTIFFFIFLIAFIVLSFVGPYTVADRVLWLTGVVILLYTAETQGLRLEMVRQNEIAIQPLLIATVEVRSEQRIGATSRNSVVFKNIGNGPALFIQLSNLLIAEEVGARFVATFEKVDYLEPQKETVVDVKWRAEFDEGDVGRPYDFTANLNPRTANNTYDLCISYEDINGQKRESFVRFGKGGIKLLQHGKTVTRVT